MNKLYAEYHLLQFAAPYSFSDTWSLQGFTEVVLGIPFSEFKPVSYASAVKAKKGIEAPAQYKENFTYDSLVNLELTNSPKHGKNLSRITFTGKAFESRKFDIGRILTVLEEHDFTCTEAHSRILLAPDQLQWKTIDTAYKSETFTVNCKQSSQFKDPSNDFASTIYFGKRPRSQSVGGKRLSFYQADKVHPELAPDTVEMELQTFGPTAQAFVYDRILRDIDLTVKMVGLAKAHVAFKKAKSGDKNLSRRANAQWWDTLVGSYQTIHLPQKKTSTPSQEAKANRLKADFYKLKLSRGTDFFLETLAAFLRERKILEQFATMI